MKTDLRKPKRWARKAFTLVEVVFTMAVIGILVVVFYAGLTHGVHSLSTSRYDQRATQIMVQLMDGMRLFSWSQITDKQYWPKKFDLPFDPAGATNGTGAGITYRCTMDVKNGPGDVDYQDLIKTVTLRIEWRRGNDRHMRDFTTFVVKDGLQSYVY